MLNGLSIELDSNHSFVFLKGNWVDVKESSSFFRKNLAHDSQEILNLKETCANKWVAQLKNIPDNVFLQVHSHFGKLKGVKNTSHSYFLHFRSISTNWKWNRVREVKFSSLEHELIDITNYQLKLYHFF